MSINILNCGTYNSENLTRTSSAFAKDKKCCKERHYVTNFKISIGWRHPSVYEKNIFKYLCFNPHSCLHLCHCKNLLYIHYSTSKIDIVPMVPYTPYYRYPLTSPNLIFFFPNPTDIILKNCWFGQLWWT